MSSWAKSFCFALVALAGACMGAAAQANTPEPLYDPTQLPSFRGIIQLFTVTPRGDIDGFLLADGIEVKTPPHLTADIAAAVRPGDHVSIHGLKAASLPLIQAMSVRNDATGVAVIDAGPRSGRPTSSFPISESAQPAAIQGRIRQSLHGPRGDIDGALLEDGTVLKLPPPEAARFGELLAAGRRIEARGVRFMTPVGSFVSLTALGAAGSRLDAVSGNPPPPPLPAPQP